MFWTHIRANELGVLLRYQKVVKILESGIHLLPAYGTGVKLVRVSTSDVLAKGELVPLLARFPKTQAYAEVVILGKNERALVYRDLQLHALLEPGVHVIWKTNSVIQVTVYQISVPQLNARDADSLSREELLKDALEVVTLNEDQRAFAWSQGRLLGILGPGTHAFWKVLSPVTFEVYNIHDSELKHKHLPIIMKHPHASGYLTQFNIAPGFAGVLYRDGNRVGLLNPGLYAFWNNSPTITILKVDLQIRPLEINGQELLTKDKVTIRMNLFAHIKTIDPVTFVEASANTDQALYREAQLLLRAAISNRELDSLLEDKLEVTEEITRGLKAKAESLGVEVTSVGIRDFILPGDMRELMNKVVEARKVAEAANIHRREETAATRSQMNTAKMLENNPALVRMRELETLERVVQKGNITVILGEQHNLLDRLTSLTRISHQPSAATVE